MKELISESDIQSITKLNNKRFKVVNKALMQLTGINKLNELYKRIADNTNTDFIDAFFEELNLNIEFDEKELRHIPKNGKFITISNHPFGAIDGLVLLKILKDKRPDFKIMANFLLQNIPELSEKFIAVNPFETVKTKSSVNGVKAAYTHLEQGNAIGIFPAGEVSSYQTNSRRVTDNQWKNGSMRIIQRSAASVIPIFFSGGNSLFFHLIGLINPTLRTAQLPKEMLRKKDATLKIRIGSPIKPETIKAFDQVEVLSRYLRSRTYSLSSGLEIKNFFFNKKKKKVYALDVIPPVESELIENELVSLPTSQKIISQGEFDVYLAFSNESPNALKELGRLREETFRAVGEGTNLSIDVDEYDLYYHHLILWDREQKKIAGAYRLGKGNDIITKFGKRGFYINSLFTIKKQMLPVLNQSLELGRSFVREEYQMKRLPLFLLWKGLMNFIISNPEYRYIIGPVSISNSYARISKQVIVNVIKKYYFDNEKAQWVKPKHKFRADIKNQDVSEILNYVDSDLKNIDRLISDIEPLHFTLPVLLKKYINQNAKIICFNRDPNFNNALDGLMILDLKDLSAESIESYS
jgi:putative hemolysin